VTLPPHAIGMDAGRLEGKSLYLHLEHHDKMSEGEYKCL